MTVDEYEQSIIDRAVGWSAVLVMGQGVRYRIDCDSLEEARSAAALLEREYSAGPRRAIVYAITEDGRSVPLGNSR